MPNLGSGNVIKNESFFRGWIIHTKKKRDPSTGPLFCLGADGESRTRTGLRPPPPQSGVSTISPHPLLNWDCKDMQFILHCNILFEFFHSSFFQKTVSPIPISEPRMRRVSGESKEQVALARMPRVGSYIFPFSHRCLSGL